MHTILRKYSTLFLILPFLVIGCRPKDTSTVEAAFSAWFVNPSESNLQRVLSSLPPKPDWKEILNGVERSNVRGPGKYVEILEDLNATPYALGFQTPKSLRIGERYPLIVYLHGGTGGESNAKGEHAHEMLSPLADSADLFIASPSANGYALWWSKQGMERILQTVRFMSLHYPIDPQRVFLMGVSDGATGCYAAANCIPGPFAGFVAISGYGGLLKNFGVGLTPNNLVQRPIFHIYGGKDRLYAPEKVDSFLTWLGYHGVSVERSFHPDGEHGFGYREQEISNLLRVVRTWVRPSRTGALWWDFLPDLPSLTDQILTYELHPGLPSATLRVRWTNDTLYLKNFGVARFSLARNQTGLNSVYVKEESDPMRKVQVSKPDSKEVLGILLQHANPFTTNIHQDIIEIKELLP